MIIPIKLNNIIPVEKDFYRKNDKESSKYNSKIDFLLNNDKIVYNSKILYYCKKNIYRNQKKSIDIFRISQEKLRNNIFNNNKTNLNDHFIKDIFSNNKYKENLKSKLIKNNRTILDQNPVNENKYEDKINKFVKNSIFHENEYSNIQPFKSNDSHSFNFLNLPKYEDNINNKGISNLILLLK